MFRSNRFMERGERTIKQAAGGVRGFRDGLMKSAMRKEAGVDGILVTVGLCIIALLLCVVMKDGLTNFINGILQQLTNEAKEVLSGVTP